MIELDYTRFAVLVVDDERDNLDAFRFVFRKSFSLRYAAGGAEALRMIDDLDPAVIITDQRMPGMSGITLLREAVRRRPDAAGILLTAYTDMPLLLEAINSGAVYRYVQKPWDSKELSLILRQCIERFHNLRENARLRDRLTRYAGYLEAEQQDPLDFAELSTNHPAMRLAMHRLEQLSNSAAPVLIAGETGTEKDLFARALHVSSTREGGPYVQVSCPALTGEALARELFGWEKGAWEAAVARMPGRIELADGGTLVLSELVDLPAEVANALERLMASGRIGRVGRFGREPEVEADARIVATTSQSPDMLARESAFGARLAESVVAVPSLRDRITELPSLSERLLLKYARLHGTPARRWTKEAIDCIVGYPWPGNMRELEAVVERAVLLCSDASVGAQHLGALAGITVPADGAIAPSSSEGVTMDLPSQLDDMERRELCSALERYNGNKAEVARALGIQRTTLYYRLKRLGIEV